MSEDAFIAHAVKLKDHKNRSVVAVIENVSIAGHVIYTEHLKDDEQMKVCMSLYCNIVKWTINSQCQ